MTADKEELKKWCDYCEGKITCDKGDFYTLLMEDNPGEDITRDDLKEIFKYFPNADQLYANACHYHFGDGEPVYKPGNADLRAWLMEMAVKDVKQKAYLMTAEPDLYAIMSNPQVEFDADYEKVKELRNEDLYGAYYTELGDGLSTTWIRNERKDYALREAFYGMTHDYEMVNYLFSPLMKTDIDFNVMLDFTSNGGIYFFKEGKLIVSCRN